MNFEKYVDYSKVHEDDFIPLRASFLEQPGNRKVQTKEDVHYTHIGEFSNR